MTNTNYSTITVIKRQQRLLKRRKRDTIALLKVLFAALFIILAIIGITHVASYPEQFSTQWRNQLHNKIQQGNMQAIEYYNSVYVANGKNLF